TAGLAGLLLAWWMLRALLAILPATLPALAQSGLDWHVVAFTFLLSIVTAVAFGVVPAWCCTRYDTADGLREGARGTVGGRKAYRARNGLVIAEVALAVMLLIGAVLLIQTFVRLIGVETGFRSDHVLTLEIALPKGAYPEARAAAFFETLVSRVSGLSGVEAAAVTSVVPLGGSENLAQVTIEGRPRPEPGQEIISDYRVVTPGYFRVLRIPLVEGALLPLQTRADGTRLATINETMARTWWHGESALGRRLKLASYDQAGPWYTVSGVVGDTRHTGLDSGFRPQVYVHHVQDPSEQMSVLLRTTGDPMAFAASARAAVSEIDPNQPVARVRTIEEVVRTSASTRRFPMFLIGAFAALAVTLAVVGLYAVVSFSVAERIQEMGVRLALGARPSNLLTLVLSDGLKLVGTGVTVGLGGAFALTGLLEPLLFGITARDTTTFILAPLILFVAGLVGCVAPARRAMRIDPASALRSE
ncbi:MAG: FtsX-like permease family protein, partial [Acidobacteriota bacterium]